MTTPLKKRKDPYMQVELMPNAKKQIDEVIAAVKQYTGFQEQTPDQSSSTRKGLHPIHARNDAPSSGIPAYADWLDEIHLTVNAFTKIQILETFGEDSNGVKYRQLQITITRHMNVGGRTGDYADTVIDISGSPSAAPAAPAPAAPAPRSVIYIRQYPDKPWGQIWGGDGSDAGAGASKDSSSSSSSSSLCKKDYGVQLRW